MSMSAMRTQAIGWPCLSSPPIIVGYAYAAAATQCTTTVQPSSPHHIQPQRAQIHKRMHTRTFRNVSCCGSFSVLARWSSVAAPASLRQACAPNAKGHIVPRDGIGTNKAVGRSSATDHDWDRTAGGNGDELRVRVCVPSTRP